MLNVKSSVWINIDLDNIIHALYKHKGSSEHM